MASNQLNFKIIVVINSNYIYKIEIKNRGLHNKFDLHNKIMVN